jgi:ABC-type nitrate/sulfonate/bicarbonate transport system permease component
MTDSTVEQVATAEAAVEAVEAPATITPKAKRPFSLPIPAFLLPNTDVSGAAKLAISIFWIVAGLAMWVFLSMGEGQDAIISILPSPLETLVAAKIQWQQGVAIEIITSLLLSLEAIGWAIVVSLTAAYLSTFWGFKPPVALWGQLRFASLLGMILFFIFFTNDGHALKIAILVFAISTFFIYDMLIVISNIPQSRFDHAKTLGLNRFQVLREVVMRGTLHNAFDSLRMNAAIAWMMLATVEGLSRSEGGIGVLLINLNRMQNTEAILSIQLMILVVGLAQDFAIKGVKALVCPYTQKSS